MYIHILSNYRLYIFSSPYERQRLQLESEPPDFPPLIIRGPVTWKCSKQIAVNRLDQVLMINHPVLQALTQLWYQLYVLFMMIFQNLIHIALRPWSITQYTSYTAAI